MFQVGQESPHWVLNRKKSHIHISISHIFFFAVLCCFAKGLIDPYSGLENKPQTKSKGRPRVSSVQQAGQLSLIILGFLYS